MNLEQRFLLMEDKLNQHIRSDHIREKDIIEVRDELREGFKEARDGMTFIRDGAITMGKTVQDILQIVRYSAIGIAGIVIGERLGLADLLVSIL